jgi:carbamoyl-phosphate synthase large subunit
MNILLLPVGKRAYLIEFFKKALGNSGEVHVSNTEVAPAFFAADKYFVSPSIYSHDYKDAILQYCLQNNIAAVIPLSDLNLPVFSRAKPEFLSHGIMVISADADIIDACNDKWKTYQYMNSHNINTPKTYLTKDDFLESVTKGECTFPVMVKPRFGVGTFGVFEAENEDEIDLYLTASEKLLKKSYLKNSFPVGLQHPIILQEKMHGEEYGLDVVNDLKGNYRATFIKHKLGIINGESNPIVFEDIEAIRKVGKQIGDTLKHIGNCNVDCFYSGEQVFILDINPRFGGCYPYSQLAGANVPKAIVRWLQGEEPDTSDLAVRFGTYCYKDNVAKIGRMK